LFEAFGMGLRLGLPLIVAFGLAACSDQPPVAGAVDGVQPIAGAEISKPAASPSKPNLRCKTVLGEVEGFGRESVRATAEKSREKVIAAEVAHRKEIGQTVASVDLQATECVAVYPIGAEEWHCMARARICAQRGL
jgi:hypothetical protein